MTLRAFLTWVSLVLALCVGVVVGHMVTRGYMEPQLGAMEMRIIAAEVSLVEANIELAHAQARIMEALTFTGVASWYGTSGEHGRIGANGKRFDMHKLTAAAKRLPFGSRWKVTRLDNDASIVVEITDDGPNIPGRLIDLSYAAGKELGIIKQGLAKVKIEPAI